MDNNIPGAKGFVVKIIFMNKLLFFLNAKQMLMVLDYQNTCVVLGFVSPETRRDGSNKGIGIVNHD